MSQPQEMSPGGQWTVETYAAHNEALRAAEQKFQVERDRRYLEVDIEKEKALKIKETADLAALQLARDIQIYKDEKANVREQINSERGLYVQRGDLTALAEKLDATIKPLSDYVTSQQGGPRALTTSGIYAALAAFGVVAALWFGTHRQTPAPVVTSPAVTVTTGAP